VSARPPVWRDANGREIINGHVIENGMFRPPVLYDPPDEPPVLSPVHVPAKARRGRPQRASIVWSYCGGWGAYRVQIRGRNAEWQAGKQFIVEEKDGSGRPVSVVLRDLIEWSAANKTDPSIALYSFRRVAQ
jgi:hypothetical protein